MYDKDYDCPEMDYFMNECQSDVVFIIGGERLPALKSFLSVRNIVFRAKFSNQSVKEVVIKDTTFEAFKTFIRFLYCDQLVVEEEDNELILIEEVLKLSQRYEAFRLMNSINDYLMAIDMNDNNFEYIQRIALKYKIQQLIHKVMEYIDKNQKLFELMAKRFNLKEGGPWCIDCYTSLVKNLFGSDFKCHMCEDKFH